MTPLPKKRHAKARSKTRRAAYKLQLPKVITCANCGNLRLPHLACPNCGSYKQAKSEEKK